MNAISGGAETEFCSPHSICGLNSLPLESRRKIFAGLVPPDVLERYQLDLNPDNPHFDEYFQIIGRPGCPSVEVNLYHKPGFPDPLLCAQLTDTPNGPLHILYFAANDPDSPRFDVDRLPNGETTDLGTRERNIEAETASMLAGLNPGQVRRGLRVLGPIVEIFEQFVGSLGHELFFVQPLFYHNAVMFENKGFAYAKGRRLMERIHQGFQPGGEFAQKLEQSSPFRSPEAAQSIRLRSWALHDGLMQESFFSVTMYKTLGISAEIRTAPGCTW